METGVMVLVNTAKRSSQSQSCKMGLSHKSSEGEGRSTKKVQQGAEGEGAM